MRTQPDDLAHYIACPRLWTEIDECTGRESEVTSVAERFLLHTATLETELVVASLVYHALKIGQIGVVTFAGQQNDFAPLLR